MGIDGSWHTSNKATIWRWRSAYQHDFAARMDWTIKPYAEANHPPEPKVLSAANLDAAPGARVDLRAEAADPDGDAVSFSWFYYPEAGGFSVQTGRTGAPIEIHNANSKQASFVVPKNAFKTGTLHIVLAVTDSGTPALTRYRRIVINVIGPVEG
jgi:hypothetical protein